MDKEDADWDNEVGEKELLWPKGTVAPLIDHAVDQEDGAGGVEGSSQECEDETGVFGEGIG